MPSTKLHRFVFRMKVISYPVIQIFANWNLILGHNGSDETDNLFSLQFKNCFSISVPTGDGQQQFVLRANSDQECTAWIEAITKSR